MKNKSRLTPALIALALAAALPMGVQAASNKDLSYTYVEADYINIDDSNAGGWGLRGSVALGNTGIYALGSYSWLNADGTLGGDIDVKANEFGVGYHHGVGDKADLLVEAAYRNADTGTQNIDGLRTSVGVRAGAERLEGFVKANYYDVSDYSGDVTGTVGGQFKFTDMLGVTAEAEFGSGNQAYLLGLRASF